MKAKKITIEITGPKSKDCKIIIDGRPLGLVQTLRLEADVGSVLTVLEMSRYNRQTSMAEPLNIEWEK